MIYSHNGAVKFIVNQKANRTAAQTDGKLGIVKDIKHRKISV